METEKTSMNPKDIYEQQKKERQMSRESTQHKQNAKSSAKKIAWTLVGILLLVLVGYGLIVLSQKIGPEGEDLSQAIAVLPTSNHIPESAPRPAYNSNPPTSGDHYATPARTGFRGDVNLSDEHFVHTLEHGNIWISYQPDVTDAVIESLKDIAGNQVVVSQRDINEFDIAIVAWGRLDTFDVGEVLTEADIQRMQDFIKRYLNKGPERLPPTAHSQGV